jgi:DNA-binding transcriptional LysR family regulator
VSRRDSFAGISEFLAVAEQKSFRAAAAGLGVTPAAVSQAVRALEARVGLPLFQRTTRRVGLTEAGSLLMARLQPAATQITESLEALGDLRDRPSGLLRLSVPRLAVPLVIEPLLPEFCRAYPDVSIDVDVNDAAIDLTRDGFDAGIRIGELIERDMIAVRLTADFRWSVLGSPGYFATRGRPLTPEDLTAHECIRYRFPTSRIIYRWEFVRDGREFSIEPQGKIVVNDGGLFQPLACSSVGLIYTAEAAVQNELRDGRLERVLESYLPVTPGLFLYFPARAQLQPKLRAFIDAAASRRSPQPPSVHPAGNPPSPAPGGFR